MFNSDQISIIEDRVINKILFPIHVLTKAEKEGILTKQHLILAVDNLQDLIDWVKDLRR